MLPMHFALYDDWFLARFTGDEMLSRERHWALPRGMLLAECLLPPTGKRGELRLGLRFTQPELAFLWEHKVRAS